MRTSTPRLPPLTDAELDPEQEAFIARFRETGSDIAVTRASLRHLRALKALNVIATHVLLSPDNTLPARDREILILRQAWRCKSGYEWARHVLIGRRAGLSDAEIAALKRPIEEGPWSDRDATLIATADALVTDHHIPDELWSRLSAHFDTRQCIDAILAVGFYTMMAMFLNSAGIQVDADATLDPDLDFRP